VLKFAGSPIHPPPLGALNYLQDDLCLQVLSVGRQPFGLGIFELVITFQKNHILSINNHDIDGILIYISYMIEH
jgi:hypothetical protein